MKNLEWPRGRGKEERKEQQLRSLTLVAVHEVKALLLSSSSAHSEVRKERQKRRQTRVRREQRGEKGKAGGRNRKEEGKEAVKGKGMEQEGTTPEGR